MRITSTAGARAYFASYFEGLGTERLCAVHLGVCGVVLGVTIVEGERARVAVPIRRLVADALALDARAMLLAHNHPGGSREPSHEDLRATRLVAQATDLVGVRLHDHVIWTSGGCTSLRERGLI